MSEEDLHADFEIDLDWANQSPHPDQDIFNAYTSTVFRQQNEAMHSRPSQLLYFPNQEKTEVEHVCPTPADLAIFPSVSNPVSSEIREDHDMLRTGFYDAEIPLKLGQTEDDTHFGPAEELMPDAFGTTSENLPFNPMFLADENASIYTEPSACNFAFITLDARLPLGNTQFCLSHSSKNSPHEVDAQYAYMLGLNGGREEYTASTSNAALDMTYTPTQTRERYGSTPPPESYNVDHNSHELSPVDSNISLTPSASSAPSTQTSFFSANYSFHRISLDQPPMHTSRPLLDLLNRVNKVSGDGLLRSSSNYSHHRHASHPSQISQGRYTSFTHSLSNMIPFMADRHQRSPLLSSDSPQSPLPDRKPEALFQNLENLGSEPISAPRESNRRYIRNMFKSPSSPEEKTGPVEGPKDLVDAAQLIEIDANQIQHLSYPYQPHRNLSQTSAGELNPVRKQRRRRRRLFTRFVPGAAKVEPPFEDELMSVVATALDNKAGATTTNAELEFLDSDSTHSGLSSLNALRQPYGLEIPLNADAMTNDKEPYLDTLNKLSSLDTSNKVPSADILNKAPSQSLDYSALFRNVGKRSKSLVMPSTFLKLKRIKEEPAETSLEALPPLDAQSVIVAGEDAMRLINELNVDGAGEKMAEDEDNGSTGKSFSIIQFANGSSKEHFTDVASNCDLIANSATDAVAQRVVVCDMIPANSEQSGSGEISQSEDEQVATQISAKTIDLLHSLTEDSADLTNAASAKCKTRGRKEDKEADKVDESKIFLCKYCSRRFKRQEHLKRHVRSLHTMEKPFNCTVCNKSFSRADNLNQHMKTHSSRDEEVCEKARLKVSAKAT